MFARKIKVFGFIGKFFEADMVTHIIIASVMRLLLIAYGVFHDSYFDVPYTDIDYKVFTDAARYVVNGASPYKRHTYRYSPLIAIILTPNIYFHSLFGKIIFAEVDLIVAYFIRRLVYLNVFDWMSKYEAFTSQRAPLMQITDTAGKNTKNKIKKRNFKVETAIYWAHKAMLFWLYNPLTASISTRGNSDSLSCLLVILTLYGIQTQWSAFVVGLVHGLAIHFRIYPIIYSLLYFMHYSKYAYYFEPPKEQESEKAHNRKGSRKNKVVRKNSNNEKRMKLFRTQFWWYLWPNLNQVKLVLGTFYAFINLTGIFYYFYGYKFLYESLIYHFVRIDFKHNFSLYFYLQYLRAFVNMPLWYYSELWIPLLINLTPIMLIVNISIRYGLNKFSLSFAALTQTIVFVIFNKVVTSQYFVWIMGLLPLCIWQIKMSKGAMLGMMGVWSVAQTGWLLPAYLLEFQGENTFIYIFMQGVALFCAHIAILGRLIKNFILPLGVRKDYRHVAPYDAFFNDKVR